MRIFLHRNIEDVSVTQLPAPSAVLKGCMQCPLMLLFHVILAGPFF